MQRDPVLAVVTVGVIAQKHQVIPHLAGGLPKPLPLLPAVPAIEPCGAEDHCQRNGDKGFDKRKPELYEPLSGDFRPLQRVASSLETGSKNKTDMKKNRR